MQLSQLKIGQKAIISRYIDPEIGVHFLSTGLNIGAPVQVKRRTIGGNTLYVRSNNKRYALRSNQARWIEIKICND